MHYLADTHDRQKITDGVAGYQARADVLFFFLQDRRLLRSREVTIPRYTRYKRYTLRCFPIILTKINHRGFSCALSFPLPPLSPIRRRTISYILIKDNGIHNVTIRNT